MIKKSSRLDRVHRVFEPYDDRRGMVRLDRNEDPVGWEPEAFQDLMSTMTTYDMAAYADSFSFAQRLAQWLKLPIESIYVTAGSDQAIKNVFETYIDRGQVVVLPNPSWRMYEIYGAIYGAKMEAFDYRSDYQLPYEEMLKRLEQGGVRMLVLANPNQPIGSVLESGKLESLIQAARHHDTLVLLDEAYHLYHEESYGHLIPRYDNLVITRTFSKAFGLAGLRLGYILAQEALIKDMMCLRPVTDANSFALKIGEYVLDHMDWVESRVREFTLGREFLESSFAEAGVRYVPSKANFIHVLFESTDRAKQALASCKKQGYLLKVQDFPPVQHSLRVTVGPRFLMERFWADCRNYFVDPN